ncbi:MAG: VOC family protein [Dinghuibacter sp.]|nr:VOC family protein [Dinghuibacter sp.]
MNNIINWFEIPATDFSRAVAFYNAILGLPIKETEMFGTKMGFFPTNGTNVSGAIVQGEGYTPAASGVLVYLNGGSDLQNVLDKVESNNGTVIVPKTQISPEMGYFGMFLDTEGNKMAVHSMG